MARKTKEEAEQTRQAIIRAATELFWARGVSRTSLADIASQAGVTRGAIYWHFSGKLDVFNAMCAEIAPIFEQSYLRMTQQAPGNAAASLWQHCMDSFRIITASPAVTRVLGIIYLRCEYVDEMSSLQSDSVEWISAQYQQVLQILEEARRQGQLQEGIDINIAAFGLQALRRGLVQLWLSAPALIPLEKQAAALMQAFFHGIFRDSCWRDTP